MKFAKSKMKFKGLKNMAKNEEMKTEFEVFKDVWNIYKKFYFVTDELEYWDQVINECNKIREKHIDSTLCGKLLLVILEDLEERGKHDD
ncbi:MAG: hypothetical protein ACLR0J_00055 [Anaerostipes hadrus]|nr:hypothetical protein [uncultured Anaerostipes sp.]